MNFGATKFCGFLLILLFCWINLDLAVCLKCEFEYSGNYYLCNVIQDSRSIVEKHVDGKTDNDVGKINFDGTINGISYLSQSDLAPFCQKFKKLSKIEIYGIKSVGENLFQQCKNLMDICIEHSEIEEIPEKLFFELPSLTEINMSFNKPGTLPEDVFINQKELEYLFLEQNQISCLPSNIFKLLTKLQLLDLSENKIQSLNPKWFENLQSLKHLWMHNNKIQDLPKHVFTKLENLFWLDLDGNQLTTIHSDSFGIHRKLWLIKLHKNKINAIDEKFIDKTEVRDLQVRGNICVEKRFDLDEYVKEKNKVKEKLSNCFKNYQPRQDLSGPIDFCSNKYVKPTENTTPTIECGTRVFSVSLRIHGGTFIDHGEYPWNVALIRNTGDLFCGGTLVSNRHVVTAAHCMQEKSGKHVFGIGDFTILLGVHNYKEPEELGRVSAKIKSIYVHKHWSTNAPNYDGDIAILELANEVQFNNYIRPICLANDDSEVAEFSHGTVVGFGLTENGTLSDIANKLEISIRDYHSCTSIDDLRDLLSARTFCGRRTDGRGVCSGDSGSGVYVSHNGRFYLRGLVSSALVNNKSECDIQKQAVFTDVTQYYGWIIRGGLKKGQLRI